MKGLKYTSNLPFIGNKTDGIVQMQLQIRGETNNTQSTISNSSGTTLNLPLSISGGSFKSDGTFISYPLTLETIDLSNNTRKPKEEVNNDVSPLDYTSQDCFKGSDTFKYISEILTMNAFSYSIFNTWNANSPFWIRINAPVPDQRTKINVNDDTDASVVLGKDVHRDCQKNLELQNDHLYYQYVTEQPLEIVSAGGITSLGRSIKKCFLVSADPQTREIDFVAFSLASSSSKPENQDHYRVSFNRMLRFLQHSENFEINQIGLRRRRQGNTLDPLAINDFFTSGIESFNATVSNKNTNNNNNNQMLQIKIDGIQVWDEIEFPKVGTFKMESGGNVEIKMNISATAEGLNPSLAARFKGVLAEATRTNKTLKIKFKNTESLPVSGGPDTKLVFFEPDSEINFQVEYNNQTSEHYFNAPAWLDFKELVNTLYGVETEVQKTAPPKLYNQLLQNLRKLVPTTSKTIRDFTIELHNLLQLRRSAWSILAMLTPYEASFKPLMRLYAIIEHSHNKLNVDLVKFKDTGAVLTQMEVQGLGKLCMTDSYCLGPHNLTVQYSLVGALCHESSSSTIKMSTTFVKIYGSFSFSENINGVIKTPAGSPFDVCLVKDNQGTAFEMSTRNSTFEFYFVKVKESVMTIRRDLLTLATPQFDFDQLGTVTKLSATASLGSLFKGDRSALLNIDARSVNGTLGDQLANEIKEQLQTMNRSFTLREQNFDLEKREAEKINQTLSSSLQKRSRDLDDYQVVSEQIRRNTTLLLQENEKLNAEIDELLKNITTATEFKKKEFMKNCLPSNYEVCPLYKCLPGVVTKPCDEPLTKNVSENVCSYKLITRKRRVISRVKTNQTRMVWRKTRICYAQCPVHFGFDGPFFASPWGLDDVRESQYFWQCRPRWILATVPIFEWKWHSKLLNITLKELTCRIVTRKIEMSDASTTLCQEATECKKLGASTRCSQYNKTQCDELRDGITSVKYSNQSRQLEAHMNETRRLSKQLDLYTIQSKTLTLLLGNLEATVNAIKVTIDRVQKRINMIKEHKNILALQMSRENNLIERYMKSNNAGYQPIRVREFFFFLQHQPRHTYPRQIKLTALIEERITNPTKARRISVSDFPFDFAAVDASIRRISVLIISELIKNTKQRARRSPDISQTPATTSPTIVIKSKKETDVRADECTKHSIVIKFILEFAEALNGELDRYKALMVLHDTLSREQVNLESLIAADLISGSLTENKTLLTYHIRKDVEYLHDLYPSLQQTFVEFLLRKNNLEFFEIGCYNYRDCFTVLIDSTIHQLESEPQTTPIKWTLMQFLSIRSTTFRVLDTQCRVFGDCSLNVKTILTSVQHPHIISAYCSQPPRITQNGGFSHPDNDGNTTILDVAVGQMFNLSINVESHFPVTTYWYLNQDVLPNIRTTNFTKTATIYDSGFYTCSVANKFGESNCNAVQVRVHQKPIFKANLPESVRVFLKSPDTETQKLVCNVSDTEDVTIDWYFKRFISSSDFTANILKVGSGIVFEIQQHQTQQQDSKTSMPNKTFRHGYYWCVASNKMFNLISDKTKVFVSDTRIAVPQISLKLKIHTGKFVLNFVCFSF